MAEIAIAYGSLPYFRIFNEGYTVLDASYQCVFKGENASEHFDDAIRVCTDYLKTPSRWLSHHRWRKKRRLVAGGRDGNSSSPS